MRFEEPANAANATAGMTGRSDGNRLLLAVGLKRYCWVAKHSPHGNIANTAKLRATENQNAP